MMTVEEKEERKAYRQVIRKAMVEALQEKAEREQRPVKAITINIEWRKSRTWGMCPHATAEIEYRETPNDKYGPFERRNGYTASGCGYDKESTVIAEIFNDFLKYKLYGQLPTDKEYWLNGAKVKTPYGIRLGEYKYYDGGIGTNRYTAISEFIGGRFENIASGKTFDVYRYTDGEA